ncbi:MULTISPECIES: hypothetical protein [unclassified Achromobacter]|uniref:hypothetical protein n=1 Tax=unclassified Achromobacter TaxID=2626865 RepID=UPI0011786039|nr:MULTISPECIES: hypothetical protein [unclassified Achromobacter]
MRHSFLYSRLPMNLAAQGLARVRQHALLASERRRAAAQDMDQSVSRMLAVSADYFHVAGKTR